MRRKIYDVRFAKASPAAQQILDRIAALFEIEADNRGRSPAARLAVRQVQTISVVAQLAVVLDDTLAKTSAKSSLAGAIRYARTRREALGRFMTDGRLEMTNNAAKRAIRPLALGRKNYLFARSDTGGQRAVALRGRPPFRRARKCAGCAAKSSIRVQLAAQHGPNDGDHRAAAAPAMEF